MRIMVYSHDAYGLGNIRRMLAICTHLLTHMPELSILLISGSPMIHGFRLPQGLDYIKIPCLSRGLFGNLSSKYLGTDAEETVALRSQLILSAAASFRPDLLLVDKKPYGINNELVAALDFLKAKLPETKLILLLRDILDESERTIAEWEKQQYHQTIVDFYDLVLVVGSADVFNLVQEYRFPLTTANKTRFCGYLRKQTGDRSRAEVRQTLGLKVDDRLVVVTPGGGEDGYALIDTYFAGLYHQSKANWRSLVICGPEMPLPQQIELRYKADSLGPTHSIQVLEFSDVLMDYLNAADVTVSMAGYNTTCEVLSLNKRAVVVPRHKPSEEQLIRAERLAQRDLLKMVHPDSLSPESLLKAITHQMDQVHQFNPASLDFNGLDRIVHYVKTLIPSPDRDAPLREFSETRSKTISI